MAKSGKRKPSFGGPTDPTDPSDTAWVSRSAAPAAEPSASEEADQPVIDVTPIEATSSVPGSERDARREAGARQIVDRHALYAAAAGLVPIPLVDAAGVAGVQVAMLRSLADHYRVPFSRDRGKALVAALVGGVLPAAAGPSVIRLLVSHVPLAGAALTIATVSTLASAATYAVGRAFIAHFESGGGLDDVDVAASRQRVVQQLAPAPHAS